jgi:RNA polymerase sigma-70 factor (ECF subfamily)
MAERATGRGLPGGDDEIRSRGSRRDRLYEEAAASHGAALERLARAYEADPDRRLDLLQDIHLALWRSFERFDERCSARTWIYRVAHNVATSRVSRRRANAPTLVSLDALDTMADANEAERVFDQRQAMERLVTLIRRLQPLDRQVMVLYLEGMEATAIGEITGISPRYVATKVHRIKKLLTQRFHEGGHHGE